MTRLEGLDGEASKFAALTFPRYTSLLDKIGSPFVAVGLSMGSRPVGLALSRVDDRNACLLSVFLSPEVRGAGYGVKLLDCLEQRLVGTADFLWAEYTSSLPQRRAFEGALRRAGWDPPVLRMVRVSGPLASVVKLTRSWPGLRDDRDARLGVAFEPWSIEAGDEAAIRDLMSEPDFLRSLAPDLHAPLIDPSISFAIRRNGKLIGWILGERLAKSPPGSHGVHVNWRAAYVTRSLWRTGVVARAFVRSVVAAQDLYGDEATASLYAALPRVATMVRNRSADPAISSVDILAAHKPLTGVKIVGRDRE